MFPTVLLYVLQGNKSFHLIIMNIYLTVHLSWYSERLIFTALHTCNNPVWFFVLLILLLSSLFVVFYIILGTPKDCQLDVVME